MCEAESPWGDAFPDPRGRFPLRCWELGAESPHLKRVTFLAHLHKDPVILAKRHPKEKRRRGETN